MIESFLIESGLGCGTVKNFSTEILKNVKLGVTDRWYFKTPIKVSSNGLRTAVVDMAFPFLAKQTDVDEKTVLSRLELLRKDYEDDLLYFLRSHKFIVPPDTANFSIIPFWATETGPRNDRKDFAGIRVHILNAVITVKYRNRELTTGIDPVLAGLQSEQLALESRIDTLTTYIESADFDNLDPADQLLLTDQLEAMNSYNEILKTRIENY
jgi:hypothetical protein